MNLDVGQTSQKGCVQDYQTKAAKNEKTDDGHFRFDKDKTTDEKELVSDVGSIMHSLSYNIDDKQCNRDTLIRYLNILLEAKNEGSKPRFDANIISSLIMGLNNSNVNLLDKMLEMKNPDGTYRFHSEKTSAYFELGEIMGHTCCDGNKQASNELQKAATKLVDLMHNDQYMLSPYDIAFIMSGFCFRSDKTVLLDDLIAVVQTEIEKHPRRNPEHYTEFINSIIHNAYPEDITRCKKLL